MNLGFYLIRILLSDWKSRRFQDSTRVESQQHRKSKRFEDNTGMEFQQQQM